MNFVLQEQLLLFEAHCTFEYLHVKSACIWLCEVNATI